MYQVYLVLDYGERAPGQVFVWRLLAVDGQKRCENSQKLAERR